MLPKSLYSSVLFWCSLCKVQLLKTTCTVWVSCLCFPNFPNVMPRQKLWTGGIHRKSHQFYCQGDFSCISLTEKFLTSYPTVGDGQCYTLEVHGLSTFRVLGWHSILLSINQSINKLYLPSILQCSTQVLISTTLINNYNKKLILYNK